MQLQLYPLAAVAVPFFFFFFPYDDLQILFTNRKMWYFLWLLKIRNLNLKIFASLVIAYKFLFKYINTSYNNFYYYNFIFFFFFCSFRHACCLINICTLYPQKHILESWCTPAWCLNDKKLAHKKPVDKLYFSVAIFTVMITRSQCQCN